MSFMCNAAYTGQRQEQGQGQGQQAAKRKQARRQRCASALYRCAHVIVWTAACACASQLVLAATVPMIDNVHGNHTN